MVNLELFNIVEDVRKVSKAFVVHPKNVNAESAAGMIFLRSRKLLLLNPRKYSKECCLGFFAIHSFTGYVVLQATSGNGK